MSWSSAIFMGGLGNIYSSGTNYLPLYHYFLLVYSHVQGSLESIHNNIYSLKYFTLIFDVVCVYISFLFVKDKLKNSLLSCAMSLLILFNIAYLYNTVIWAQVDSIFTAFLFLAFYFSIKNKILLPTIFLILAVNMKLQAIIFIPFIVLILLPTAIKKFKLKSFLHWLSITASLQFIILLPFILSGELNNVIDVVMSSIGAFPAVSLNAYNIWCWLIEGNLMYIPDTNSFLELSYYHWGLFMFTLLYFFTLFPLIRNRFLLLSNSSIHSIHLNKLLIMGTLIPLIFFFFNTQMHERYSHPMLLFAGTYAILNKKYIVYTLLSIAYFLNLELVLDYFNLENSNIFFLNPDFVAALFFAAILLLFFNLYKGESKTEVK
ncbi:MAG: hypothetical protein ACKVQV_06810 [Bacteroidia bacterium]